MYDFPVVIVVTKTSDKDSVDFISFYLSLFSFLANELWMAYGLLSHDIFLARNIISTSAYSFHLHTYKSSFILLSVSKFGIGTTEMDRLEYKDDKLKQEFQLDEKKESVLVVTENISTKI
ncbi:hypothetical protein H5410_031001 [Solanum commersonii]|uniref:Uncharacterized protein n=1 Tax=Solanum commersonii TaxID=4109 RepID=A0A9J5YIK4_SOLCO|nr:hypothetical protein H5410_031001 [Solanum commersonii]